jgi:hypothetical protein
MNGIGNKRQKVLANDIPAMELNSYEWELKIIQDGA